ncbi:DUF4249 family protein [candidate division WOR-3 bacterium]|nr:DUF4249 family protein [candidate division WOR-3 bacterium]
MKKTRRNSVILAVLFIILISCEKSLFEEYEPELNIFCLLECHLVSYITVTVDRTYRMDEPSDEYIDDALVILSGPNSVDTLQFIPEDSVYHSPYPLLIQPEKTYQLTVVKEGFDTLIAQTKTPGNFSIVYPQSHDTLTISDTIILTKSSGAPYYYGYFTDENDYKIPFWYVPDTLDSLVRIPIPFYLTFAQSGYYRIEILACDENYYQYSQFKPEQDSVLQAGVTGGVGVFASYRTRYVYVYFVLE